jgi:predicted Rossmann fold flavoprotein
MNYDAIIVGAGACGIIAAIKAAQDNNKVLLIEQLPKIGAKLKASGGGRCNLTNNLPSNQFLANFGSGGKFIKDILNYFSQKDLIAFFNSIGVNTISKDGFRVFPKDHNSQTIIDALLQKIKEANITLLTNKRVDSLIVDNAQIFGVKSNQESFFATKVVIATGGLGYQNLGATGDGYNLAKSVGHKITNLYPAMLPLKTKEKWVANCRADTIAKATLKVNIKKHKKLKASGDLIFAKDGIKGPVVLDFAREITPLLEKYKEVPLIANFVKNLNQEQIMNTLLANPKIDAIDALLNILPQSVAIEFCKIANIEPNIPLKQQNGNNKETLYKLIAKTPLTIINHGGFKSAMATRGGISLKEINPKTMQSKLVKGLYFCGEVVDIDGPCGGYNLQYCFSSGYVAGSFK